MADPLLAPLPDPIPAIARLTAIMARLRGPEGCEWDRAQDFATIAPYTIEEAYEVADAVQRGDMADLREELGDLLLQVVFHAQIAQDAGLFTLADVATIIADKMERRHPHLFGDADQQAAAAPDWEATKAAEKPRAGALNGVAAALPALMRADKIQRRAARVGFDWPNASGPRAKVLEELGELTAATSAAERLDEGGDLLFAVVNLLRHDGVDPEVALRAATAKFERRFASMEAAVGPDFPSLDLATKEALWDAAKNAERQSLE
jgi:ATP diphosphatase